MAKEIIYNRREHQYLVKEGYQSKDQATFWANCPYDDSQSQEIETLRKSYENALNSAEWLKEKEAKEAFLGAGDIICTFFSSKDASMEELLGDLRAEDRG